MTTSSELKPAVKRARAEAPEANADDSSGLNRREFLYYVWGASMVMMLGACGGIIVWFAYPRFRAGEFGGDFIINPAEIPDLETQAPGDNAAGRFWLTNTETGIGALYKVCTHLGCLFKWVDNNNRFECPCHGSKFELNGLYIEGPAPRGLDRFEMTATLADGSTITQDENGFLEVVDKSQITELIVHTGSKLNGPPAGTESYEEA